MIEREHAQIILSGSSQNRANGQSRRTSRHKTYFRWHEIIRIGVLRATTNLSRNQRVIQGEKRKNLKSFSL